MRKTNKATPVESPKSADEEKTDAAKQKSVVSETVDEKSSKKKRKFGQKGELKDKKSADAKDENREDVELTQEDLRGILTTHT